MRRRYPGKPPAPSNLESYLSREGFASAAIGPASRAYLETCRFLELEGAYDSEIADAKAGSESIASAPIQEAESMRPQQPVGIAAQTVLTPNHGGMRRDVFTLSGGGEVILTLPQSLSQQDYDDLKDWLDLMGRKARRSVSSGEALASTNEQLSSEQDDGNSAAA